MTLSKYIPLFALILCIQNANAENKGLSQRFIPKLNISVSFIGLGTVELGRDWGIDVKTSVHPTESAAKDLLQTSLKSGITVVDTATSYQLSEKRIGKYIPRSHHNYLLITKPGEHSVLANDPDCKKLSYDKIYCAIPGARYDFSRHVIIKDITASLKHLKVDKIDVALLHLDSASAQEILEKGEALETLRELK